MERLMPRKSGTHDATAVARCLSGDQAAFGELVKRYQGLAVAVAFSICHERSLAEDVAQDAFVMAYRKLKQLARHESFCAWLVNIVRNAALRSAHNVARREEVHKLASADTRPHTEDGRKEWRVMKPSRMRTMYRIMIPVQRVGR